MLRALQLPPFAPASAVGERSLLDEHTVSSVLLRPFGKKVPHLILYLKDALPGAGNVFGKFVDPTGASPSVARSRARARAHTERPSAVGWEG